MKKIVLIMVLFVFFVNFVSANCFESGCLEGYYCEPENRTCVEIDQFEVVLINDHDLTEQEEKFFGEMLDPFGGFEEVKQIPLALLKTNELMVRWQKFSFGFGLDWLGKPKIEFVDSKLE